MVRWTNIMQKRLKENFIANKINIYGGRGMSIKSEYEVRTRTITEKVCVSTIMHCDVCDSVIDPDHESYWELTTGHHDWGNDSCESIQYFDICSEACLKKKFDEYVKESGVNDDNTMYFEVNRA